MAGEPHMIPGDTDFHTLYKQVYNARDKWHNLGLALGVDHQVLVDIESKKANNEDRLRDMLASRLQTGGPLSWEDLCEKLRDVTVSRNDVAEGIEQWIHESLFVKPKEREPKKKQDIPSSRMEETEHPVATTCNVKGIDACVDTHRKRSVDSEEPPVVSKSQRKENLKTIDLRDISWNEIEEQFGKVVTSIQESIASRNVEPRELVLCLQAGYFHHLNTLQCETKMFGQIRMELCRKTLDDFWLIISDFFTFYSFKILSDIVNSRYGTETDQSILKKYENSFTTFSKEAVAKCARNVDLASRDGTTVVVIKIAKKFELINQEHLIKFKEKLADTLGINKSLLHLVELTPGSTILTYHAPLIVEVAAFPLSSEQENNLQSLEVLSLQCGDYQLPSEEDITLLTACKGGHTDTAQLLIDKGAYVNLITEELFGTTPLVAACEGGHIVTARLLIDKGADVNDCALLGITPLVAACKGGHTDTARLLIDKGADVNKLAGGTTPLVAACKGGHTDTARLLIDKGADVNEWARITTPLAAACEGGHTDTARLLIDKGADVNKSDVITTPLVAACKGGHTDTARLLIDKRADVNKSDVITTPLVAACEGGHTDTARLLIDKGADVKKSAGITTPLVAACKGGHTDTARLLIDKGADVNKSAGITTPLVVACKGGHTDTARLLIDKGADVNKSDADRSPLKAAHEGHHTETAQFLVSKGATDPQQLANFYSRSSVQGEASAELFSYLDYSRRPRTQTGSDAGSGGSAHSRTSLGSVGSTKSFAE